MGALRKAGVWLGLVEEDDERAYEDGGYDKGGYRDSSRYRSSRYAEEFADEDDDEAEEPPTTRSRLGDRGRLSERASSRAVDADRAESERPERAERSSVRSITRSSAGDTSGALTYHTRDNLALAPQAQPRERERVAPEDEQRYQITTLHPTTYREARTIGEHFRDGVPVIINLTEMDEADARRLVDFAAGLAFGLRGTIERVTNRVFLLSPANVQVTAEDKAKIAEGGFFSLS
ncbi:MULTISPECIES: cell division protein SepF [Micromonospora]|uniref:Cell division protein SepF n=1 Tax=Micromonospora tulbaghiae TaxID=479978 RepID=A0AAW4JP03_9ACTN|nr:MULTISPECIES: cell division protein SepF [Micromonospora]KAB1906038.1 cell division protein SepF [Micromonospora sp. AMSO1212t]MBO4140564.1 cell division protein SepF [Micromonospora tulbaghiae]MDX5457786.1 cell division protein SepF [Micromonospora tulbaghiae]RBI97056.1 cell division protein SepF [Micromonospora provocatoris]SCE88391.1 cell division inhibitor SepF [Micromonospora tulbaghiae]